MSKKKKEGQQPQNANVPVSLCFHFAVNVMSSTYLLHFNHAFCMDNSTFTQNFVRLLRMFECCIAILKDAQDYEELDTIINKKSSAQALTLARLQASQRNIATPPLCLQLMPLACSEPLLSKRTHTWRILQKCIKTAVILCRKTEVYMEIWSFTWNVLVLMQY